MATEAGRPTTLRPVEAPPRRWSDYAGIVPAAIVDEALELGARLRGARVLHLNATAFGGGVAELLSCEIGLLRDLGIDAEWRVICPDAELFQTTKRLHNAIQGQHVEFTAQELEHYRARSEHCAAMLADEWDLIVIHDPQPAPLLASDPCPSARWIWRCHIDSSTADQGAWSLLRQYVELYDAAVFTLEAFRPPDLRLQDVRAIAPGIDPLSVKNQPLPRYVAHGLVARAGLDLGRPLVVQVSRFDPWKDPLGVVEAWRHARGEIPGLQLALVGSMADDDPEGWEIYEAARRATAGEPDCHLLTNQTGIGAIEVNAFQREADIAVQKSLREGFGLTVAEALWKETPVIGGNAGGIPMQIGANEGGILVDSVDECAQAIVTLLAAPSLLEEKAEAGRERVRQEFLLPRLARDDMRLYADLLAARPSSTQQTSRMEGVIT